MNPETPLLASDPSLVLGGRPTRVNDTPGMLLRDFRAKAVYLIIIALHAHQRCAINLRGNDFLRLRVQRAQR